jgi:hypothetical protein
MECRKYNPGDGTPIISYCSPRNRTASARPGPSGEAGAQRPPRRDNLLRTAATPSAALLSPRSLSRSLTQPSMQSALRQQSLAALTRSLCRAVPAPAPAGGRTLRVAREQGPAGAAGGSTGPHVAWTARRIPCQIANKIYRGLSCFSRDFPSLFDLLPPFSEYARDSLNRVQEVCHEAVYSGLQIHISTSPYGALVFASP